MSSMRGPHGLEVVPVIRNGRPQYRIDQVCGENRYWVADCYDVTQVARYVDFADLVEVFDFPPADPPPPCQHPHPCQP